jgi:hypothetical protein
MKLIQWPVKDTHHKNTESIKRMCKAWNLEYEGTDDFERLNIVDYIIVWLPLYFIHPMVFPLEIRILYGPQLFTFPEGPVFDLYDEEMYNLNKHRCVYTSLSTWNYNVYNEFGRKSLIPIAPLPFGINTQELLPVDKSDKPFLCMLYTKMRNIEEVHYLKTVLRLNKVPYLHLNYGDYTDSEYQNALDNVKFCIWFGCTESQGFAFQECLSKNVPILVISPKTMFETCDSGTVRMGSLFNNLIGNYKLVGTTASYWDDTCGIYIEDLEKFQEAYNTMLVKYKTFEPRKFVEERLNDARTMYDILSHLNMI